jgi:LAO/AO transport system kinase
MSGGAPDVQARRRLARALSLCAADVSGLEGFAPAAEPKFRIGVTGAPGAGKSSLIGVLVGERVSAAGSVAVLAIDPTSPLTRGSVLGDRIRMDAASGHSDVYIRSVPSRSAQDGLCDNVEALLRVLEREGFGEVLLETVGAGQVQHTVRTATDTVVMVFSPNTGDAIQAMKAGPIEMADIFVVNKADLPGAKRAAVEIGSAILRARADDGWLPPVILTSAETGAGVAELSEAIDDHRRRIVAHRNPGSVEARRVRHHATELLHRHLAAAAGETATASAALDEVVAAILARFLETSGHR